jgi:hypothetical protein
MKLATIVATLFRSLTASTHGQTFAVNFLALCLGESEVKARTDIEAAEIDIQTMGADYFMYCF